MNAERAQTPLLSPKEVTNPSPHHMAIPSPFDYGQFAPNIHPEELPLPSSLSALESDPLHLPEWWPSEYALPGSTAKHESQHVTMAILKYGVSVESVSREPGPGYRGITICSGDLRHKPHALQAIAAAGAADPIGMKAEGFGHHSLHGSDIHIAHSLSDKTGKSAEDAVNEAAAFLGTIPERAREIIASVIESLGTIHGKEKISALVHNALEIAQRETDILFVPRPTIKEQLVGSDRKYTSSIIRGDRTAIITPDEGPARLVIISNDGKMNLLEDHADEKNVPCANCGMKKTHAKDCIDRSSSGEKHEPAAKLHTESATSKKEIVVFEAHKQPAFFSLN